MLHRGTRTTGQRLALFSAVTSIAAACAGKDISDRVDGSLDDGADASGIGQIIDHCGEAPPTWKIGAYVDTRLSEQEVSSHLSKLNQKLADLEVPIAASLERLDWVASRDEIPFDLDGVHVNIHFSPDNSGGYLGPPWDRISAPLLPAGLGRHDVRVLVHESLHYFGVQDYYVLPTDMIETSDPEMSTDVMVAPRQLPVTLHPIGRAIACSSAAASREGGREAMHYPVLQTGHPEWVLSRMANQAQMSVSLPGGESDCQIFRSVWDGDTSQAGYADKPVAEVEEASGILLFSQRFYNWYLGYAVACADNRYLIPNLLVDECFLAGGERTQNSCHIDCSEASPGSWCQMRIAN